MSRSESTKSKRSDREERLTENLIDYHSEAFLSPAKPVDEDDIIIRPDNYVEPPVELPKSIDEVREKVKEFKSNVILLKLGTKHTEASKSRADA